MIKLHNKNKTDKNGKKINKRKTKQKQDKINKRRRNNLKSAGRPNKSD